MWDTLTEAGWRCLLLDFPPTLTKLLGTRSLKQSKGRVLTEMIEG